MTGRVLFHAVTVLQHSSELTQQDGKKKRRQTLCDKRDNNFVSKTFPPNFTLL